MFCGRLYFLVRTVGSIHFTGASYFWSGRKEKGEKRLENRRIIGYNQLVIDSFIHKKMSCVTIVLRFYIPYPEPVWYGSTNQRFYQIIEMAVLNMAKIGYGNFAFLANINETLYTEIVKAERQARIDYNLCGRLLRDVLETFVEIVVKGKKLENYIDSDWKLWEKIATLRSVDAMRAAGYLNPNQTFSDRALLPNMGRVDYYTENDRKKNDDYYDFMREFSNNCAHIERRPNKPKISYNNVVLALRGYHMLLRRYYSSQLPQTMPPFDEHKMRILDYVIEKSYVPEDSLRSKCVREYLGYTLHHGEPHRYVLIRMYNLRGANTTFLFRNDLCFNKATDDAITVPDGMTTTMELTKQDNAKSDFYLICYLFNRKPQPLTADLLKSMTLKQRLDMCHRLAVCLKNLHNSGIYCRMLSYESIFVSRLRDTWIPYIVKFDHAKIVADNPVMTVYMDAVQARKNAKIKPLIKYLALEWNRVDDDTPNVDWGKVDIYSLGVLMGDILLGEIGDHLPNIDDLEDEGVDEMVCDLIERMCAESPQKRCSMDEVLEVFECI